MDAEIFKRLDEITKSLNELKQENAVLRKEILGNGTSSSSQPTGLVENKTLREIIEETQFQVNVNTKMIAMNCKSKSGEKPTAGENNEGGSLDESEEYPVVEIRSKTLEEERSWMKDNFNDLFKTRTVADGESLRGTSVQDISSSIPFSGKVQVSCVLKLSNAMNSALSDPQYHVMLGSRNSGPLRVNGRSCEVFSFVGTNQRCRFIYSFATSSSVRLVIYCDSQNDGKISLGIAFCPEDVPTNEKLLDMLKKMPPTSGVWIIDEWKSNPMEQIVSHGNLHMRAHMVNGPRCVVNVEIFEMSDEIAPFSFRPEMQMKTDKSRKAKSDLCIKISRRNSLLAIKYGTMSCKVEMVNCLMVKLTNLEKFIRHIKSDDSIPLEVIPMKRNTFFTSVDSKVEAIFSYRIDTTDLAFVVALKVQASGNCFAAAFVQLPVVIDSNELDALMDPNLWTKYFFRKYATAKEGMQIIQIRNIRAEIRMTEEEQSRMVIRIYAV